MSERPPPARTSPLPKFFAPALLGSALAALPGGCLVYDVASAPVKVAAKTVVVAGETTGTVITTTGKVAIGAVRATGSVASGGLDASAQLARTGMVTFADGVSGAVVRVPWSKGLTLAGASATAKVSTAQRAVEIVRAGKSLYSATNPPATTLALHSGDVVRLLD